jgi:IS1 family transposase
VPAPEDDVIEMDKLCVRLTPSLWLWTAVSRKVRQVLGFAFGQRDRATLSLCWSDVPQDYQDKPVVTDGYPTDASFFPPEQHRAIDKDTGEIGETSIVESLNTKWRQRQSGLARRSCSETRGVSRRIETDLVERFFLLVEQHNFACQRQWEREQKTMQSDQ